MKRMAMVVFLLAGCAFEPVLIPDEGARSPDGRIAVARTGGVDVAVDGNAWRDDPIDLGDILTPVRVSIDNMGNTPIRIAYRDFMLSGESGMRYSALAPLQAQPMQPAQPGQQPAQPSLPNSSLETRGGATLQLAAYGPRVAPRFHHRSFYVAPHYGWFYPGMSVWGSPFPYDYAYGPYAWPRRLPSEDMIAEALPEGVLQPGGHVDGFVYFQGVQNREERVRFDMRIVDGNAGTVLGTAQIPLRVRMR